MQEVKQPIVVKKIIAGHGGHHGGSWKVAFADFATAMMAFFMLLWLLGQTTADQRGGISEYFQNPSMVEGTSQAPTGAMGPGGSSTNIIDLGSPIETTRPNALDKSARVKGDKYKKLGMHDTDTASGKGNAGYEETRQEHQRLDSLMVKLKEAVENNLALEPFRDQLLIDITSEGLRIQIVDKEGRPMFDSGSAILKYYTVELLNEISGVIQDAPNKISITGHTDATPFTRRKDYSNWELSADRANAARRTLLAGGIESDKIGRVVGLSSTALFDQDNPTSPVNRRISIIVMNKQTEMAMMMGDSQQYMGDESMSTEFIETPVIPKGPGSDSLFIEEATPLPSAADEGNTTTEGEMSAPGNDKTQSTASEQTPREVTQVTVPIPATGKQPATKVAKEAADLEQLPELRIDRVDLPPIGIQAPINFDGQ